MAARGGDRAPDFLVAHDDFIDAAVFSVADVGFYGEFAGPADLELPTEPILLAGPPADLVLICAVGEIAVGRRGGGGERDDARVVILQGEVGGWEIGGGCRFRFSVGLCGCRSGSGFLSRFGCHPHAPRKPRIAGTELARFQRERRRVVVAGEAAFARFAERHELRLHRPHEIGTLGREVFRLAAVGEQIEEQVGFRGTVHIGEQFVAVVHEGHAGRAARVVAAGAADRLERNRGGALSHLAGKQRHEADAVDGLGLALHLEAEELQRGGKIVEGATRNVRDRTGLDARRPFDEAGHADPAFPEAALAAAQTAGRAALPTGVAGVALGAVVTGEPDQRVVGDAEVAQLLAQPAHLFVEGGDAAVVVLLALAEAGIHFQVFGTGDDGFVRRVKPDHGEERSFGRCRLANERNGAIHEHARIVAGQIFGFEFTVVVIGIGRGVGERVPQADAILGREPIVGTLHGRRHEILRGVAPGAFAGKMGIEGAEVPLAVMAGGVALGFQDFRQADFLFSQVAFVRRPNPVAIRMAAGEHGAAGGRADRRARIETIEAQAGLRHCVEVGGLDDRVAVEARIAPAQVVGH